MGLYQIEKSPLEETAKWMNWKSTDVRKYLQVIYLIKILVSEHVKNSQKITK